ncbi:MAG TPA: ATP-binding cassette domain-containing protein [bacterium]|nr:ATP-binding cassette domain-containing protein [bacterium]
MISVKNLTKTFGRTVAVDNISFEVTKGEVVGFLGPNAAGKTTTMRMLTCYIAPDSGTANVAGFDVGEASLEVRKRVGYLPESAPLYLDMDLVAYLEFIAEVRGIPSADRPRRVRRMVEVCGLESMLGRTVGTLSKGYRQRVGLAQTLIHDPEILVLDEPTTGLDPSQIIEIRELVKEIGKERTVILSTHILPEVEVTCTRVLIINEGKIVASGTPQELQSVAGGEHSVYVSLDSGGVPAEETLRAIRSVRSVSRVGEPKGGYVTYLLKAVDGVDIGAEVFKAVTANRWTLNELRRETLSLEDIFLKLTTKER